MPSLAIHSFMTNKTLHAETLTQKQNETHILSESWKLDGPALDLGR